MQIDIPEVVAEVRAAFQRYDQALVTNDVATLDEMFRNDPRTIRYGATENLYGYEEIEAFRAVRPSVGLARALSKTVINTFGRDFAMASTLFHRTATPGKVGRMTQTWVRFDEGWRIVVGHVSVINEPEPPADKETAQEDLPMGSEPSKLKAETTYNAAADHFDDGPLAFWDRYGRRTVEQLHLLPGSSVLDVGCGSGASAIPAAVIVGPSGRVVGVDLAERLLDIARAKSIKQKLENIEFRRADMAALDYPNESFDAVVCVFAIFFVTDMVKQVQELWRVVRPGGKLAITTWGPRMFEPGSAAWWSAVKEYRPDLVTGSNPWERITTPQAVRQLLSDSGIEDADVRAEDGQQPLQSPEDWWTVVLGSGYRWTVEQMDKEDTARVRAANLKTLRDSGTKFFETNVIYAVAEKK